MSIGKDLAAPLSPAAGAAQGAKLMLYKLPNGNWIDPAIVTAIKVLAPVSESYGAHFDERVRIDLPGGDIEMVTPDNCYCWADEFAAVCNAARAKVARAQEKP